MRRKLQKKKETNKESRNKLKQRAHLWHGQTVGEGSFGADEDWFALLEGGRKGRYDFRFHADDLHFRLQVLDGDGSPGQQSTTTWVGVVKRVKWG